jgi:hypothetical protein
MITFSLNDLPIATVNASTVISGGGNILLNHCHVNSTSSTDPNRRLFQFGLIDNVMVTRPGPAAPVLSGVTRLPSGHILLNGLGIPHTTYAVEASPQLTGGVWTESTLGGAVADSDGVILFMDPVPSTSQSRLCRLSWP